MKNTNIISLLKTFSRKEFNDFDAFINSPLQIRKRDVTNYFKAIKKFYPELDSPSFTDQKVYEKIYPGKKFEKARYSSAAFYLFEAACDFLILLNARENTVESSFSLMNQFLERGMHNSFEKLAKKLDKEIVPEKFSLDSYFYLRYRYEDLLLRYHTEKHNYKSITEHYYKKTDISTGLSLLKSLRGKMNKYLYEQSYSSDQDKYIFEKIVDATDLEKVFAETENEPILKILQTGYFIYKGIFDSGNTDWIVKAEKSLFDNFDNFSKDEKVYLIRELLNLYVKYSRETNDRKKIKLYNEKQFELTKKLVDNDLCYIKKDKHMRLVVFRNIILTAADANEFDWIEKFINEYSEKLKPSYRRSMKNFSLAELEFRKGNFEKSLEFLSIVKYDSFIFKRDVKLLLLNLYYELEFIEEAYFALKNTRSYLKSTSDITEEEKIMDYNFLNYYKKLLKLKEEPDETEIQFCITEIEKIYNQIETPEWLLEKFKNL